MTTKLKILFGGDVMLGRGVNEALALRPPAAFMTVWDGLLPVLEQADYRMVNLECVLTDRRPARIEGPDAGKTFRFRADPQMIRALTTARIDAVSLANDHVFDVGEQGLLDTLDHLRDAGIAFSGAGSSLSEARAAAFLGEGPRKIALLSATDSAPALAALDARGTALPARAGTHYFPVDLEVATLDWLARAAHQARSAGASYVVLSMHWGPSLVSRPGAAFQRFARAAIDRGIDVIHGHASHLCQGVEIYADRPIFYDTGELLNDYAVDPLHRNDRSCLFQITFQEGRLTEVTLVPISLREARVEVATGAEHAAIVEQLIGLSAELGTPLQAHDGLIVWSPQVARAA